MGERECKKCIEPCFNYSPRLGGCTYACQAWFEEDFEPVKPGEPCLHPEFDESELIEITMGDFCAALQPY